MLFIVGRCFQKLYRFIVSIKFKVKFYKILFEVVLFRNTTLRHFIIGYDTDEKWDELV